MNQDTHLYIEANQKHGRGYQVHIVIDGIVDSTMADEPFSLYDALGGAQFTLEAVNKECEASAGEQQQYQGGPFEQTLNACAAKLICGSEIIPPPKSPYDLCTAGEIGEKIGITSNLVGRIANQYDLKQPEYGEWVLDVAAHSTKIVKTFRYYEAVIPILKEKLRKEGKL